MIKADTRAKSSLLNKAYLMLKYQYVKDLHEFSPGSSLIDYLPSNFSVENRFLLSLCDKKSSITTSLSAAILDDLIDKAEIEYTHISFNPKSKGQFFTNSEVVKLFYKYLFSCLPTDSTYIDLTIGKGDFLFPFLSSSNLFYGIEKDPLVYEYLLYDLLLNPILTFNQKALLFLTIKQGDTLLGLNKDKALSAINEIGMEKFIQLLNLRKMLLSSPSPVSIQYLRQYDSLSSLFSSFTGFNFFLSFPERFYNEKTKKFSVCSTFDYVVGNPPWLSYMKFDKTHTQNLIDFAFDTYLYGKYNYALPFSILGFEMTKKKGGLILPLGMLTETYAHKWREKLFKTASVKKIILNSENNWFEDISNEYSLVLWEKEKSTNSFTLSSLSDRRELEINSNSPLFNKPIKIPLIPKKYFNELTPYLLKTKRLSDYCLIRRGLTLSRKYQNQYNLMDLDEINMPIKPLIKSNRSVSVSSNERRRNVEGIFNYQLFYNGRMFVYDKELLGSAGSIDLFEQPKIVRRNRGRKWIIALDKVGYYFNDIFDLFLPTANLTINQLFGYLLSSWIHYLTENYIQRDITSNFVRDLPVLSLSKSEWKTIGHIVTAFLDEAENTFIDLKEVQTTQENIDKIIFDHLNISSKFQEEIIKETALNWFMVND